MAVCRPLRADAVGGGGGEQRLKFVVDSDLRSGRIDEALAIMSSHRPADFPPHWDPPPRVVFDPDPEMIVAVMEKVIDRPPAGWVRELYFQKFSQALFDFRSLAMFREERFVNSTWPRTERLLSRMAKSGSLSAENVESVETIRAYLEGRAPSPAATAPTTAP